MICPQCKTEVSKWTGSDNNELAAWLFHRMIYHFNVNGNDE